MGPEKAVTEGLISITQYKTVKQSIDAFKIASTKPLESETTRGTWIYGPPGVGKSRYARDNFPDVYLKPQSKWFDGYTGQQTILLDDHDNPCLGHYLKIWMDHYQSTHLPFFQSLNFHNFSEFFTPPKYCNFYEKTKLLEPLLDLSQPRPHFEVFFSCPRCVRRGTPARKIKPLPRRLPNLKSKLSTRSKSYLFCLPNFTFLPSSISMVDNFHFLMIFLPKRT